MKLPSFKRLLSKDFAKEFAKLVDQLSVSLNVGIDLLYEALNNNITLRDNVKCTVKDMTLQVDTLGKPINTSAFTLNSTSRVDGITVILAQNQTNTATYPTSTPFVSGNQNGSLFTITNISGLQPNQSYLLRLIAWQQ